jgi:hypothetical protein
MIHENLFHTAVFNEIHVLRPVECQLKMVNIHGDEAAAKQQKMLK